MTARIYRFEDFRLDPAARELWRGDQEIPLQPRALDVLIHLVEHRERAVSRDDLIEAVWASEHIADSVLGHVIFMIRRALEDNGDEPRFIKTVRRFGYRWVAPLEVEAVTPAPADDEPPMKGVRRRWLLPVMALLVAGLVAVLLKLSFWPAADDEGGFTWSGEAGDIVLVLPVQVEAEERHPWIRLGLMDLVAERLRAAGQPVVPSDTVIALLRDRAANPEAGEVGGLMSATGARLVLSARAAAVDDRWRVTLRSMRDAGPGSAFHGEADDVLEAARAAADRLTLALGLAPTAEVDAEPDLTLLLQQAEAAMLARRMELARELIDAADEDLRGRPEVRWRRALIDYYEHRFDAAREGFESLLAERAVREDPALHARVLHGLGAFHFHAGEYVTAERMLEGAALLLADNEGGQSTLGAIKRSLGVLDLVQGRFDQAGARLAQARRILEGTGDARGLALLDNNLGLLAVLRGRYTTALYYFQHSADRLAVLNDLGEEVRTRANLIQTHLGLLDAPATLPHEALLGELLDRAVDPVSVAVADAARAAALFANGRVGAGEAALNRAVAVVEDAQQPIEVRSWVLTLQAEQLALGGDLERAGVIAAEVVDLLQPETHIFLDTSLSRAWLILVRSRLAAQDPAAAARIAREMSVWASSRHTTAPEIYAALARAELAASRQRDTIAAAEFERALALADSARVPLRVLQVAESYVPWLLAGDRLLASDRLLTGDRFPAGDRPEQALEVIERIAEYAARDYRAALLQARVHHALGPPSAWRRALDRAHRLAGERDLPPAPAFSAGNEKTM